MRRDYLIAIILALAALPSGAALMVAPEYLHLTGWTVPATFWGGIGLSVLLLMLAAIIAWHGKESAVPAREVDVQRKLSKLIAEGRAIVAASAGNQDDFGDSLESSLCYLQLRPHLSQHFREVMRARGRTIIAPPDGSKLQGLAHVFLDELDRLEKELA